MWISFLQGVLVQWKFVAINHLMGCGSRIPTTQKGFHIGSVMNKDCDNSFVECSVKCNTKTFDFEFVFVDLVFCVGIFQH